MSFSASLRLILQESHYSPGDTIKGTVFVESPKELRAESLKVMLRGYAHTKWIERETRGHLDYNGEWKNKTKRDVFDSREQYLYEEKVLWEDHETEKFPAGSYSYDFSFKLPNDGCPPSFQGEFGWIRYKVEAILERPWKFNLDDEQRFLFTVPTDLKSIKNAFEPVEDSSKKNTGLLFKNGIVAIHVKLPNYAYIVGKTIPIEVNIDNSSSKPVVGARAKLIKISVYTAQKVNLLGRRSTQFSHNRETRTTVNKTETGLTIPSKTSSTVNLILQIPDFATQTIDDCDILSVDYVVFVEVQNSSFFEGSVSCELPVEIGGLAAQ